jgi:hypothetical protein
MNVSRLHEETKLSSIILCEIYFFICRKMRCTNPFRCVLLDSSWTN